MTNSASIIIPDRLHHFLASRRSKETREIPKHEYLQMIDLFHPKLRLPSQLKKGVVIRLYDILVSPFFKRKEIFDVETNTFNYNPDLRDPPSEGQSDLPVKSLFLPAHLIKFMDYHDPAGYIDATRSEYHEIINLFHPQLVLPLCLSKTMAETLFKITTRPLLLFLDDFDEDTGYLSFVTVQLKPAQNKPKRYPLKSIYLPTHLHCFLAMKDPAVKVNLPNTKIELILTLFHPHLGLIKRCDSKLNGLFEGMVLPYLRNTTAFDVETNLLRYVAVPLTI
ncbi:hypothetical protein DFH28DRAFT_887046 [Melampsora americana]|nr:hypothetical protein DFH28DRAFT_889282 [Melampsora americana]KAH9819107.1 hypothetical protein DFH28DRAFT_887046 [Melampsora americana]